jgi:aspartate/tyrosine/aromatic aminotransferase
MVLSDPQLMAEWKEELEGMANRIKHMRVALYKALNQVGW